MLAANCSWAAPVKEVSCALRHAELQELVITEVPHGSEFLYVGHAPSAKSPCPAKPSKGIKGPIAHYLAMRPSGGPGPKLPELKHLLSTSVAARALRGARVLLYSECLRDEWPEVLAEEAKGHLALCACLERDHVCHITAKLATMIIMGAPKAFKVLTVDGSPHCIQLHFAIGQALRITGRELPVEHLVVEKGRLYKIEPATVRAARHLSEVQALRDRKR